MDVAVLVVLAAGRWPLAAGRWPLAAGRWPLAAGRWPLAAGHTRAARRHAPALLVILVDAVFRPSAAPSSDALALGVTQSPAAGPRAA
ncbi:hypothetical protein [Geodermatophilus obscurus]|uniref:hypothetical protein n=1 Tax=Geodermatophilus obscurus TaxID=1861 RepID=UPI00019B74B1|nr:hypothetical protein [Geodermatophilus obscurus]